MNKRIFYSIIFLTFIYSGFAQVMDPVKWKGEFEKISDTEYNIKMIATISPSSWHLYGLEKHKDGPVATSFDFKNEGIELIDKPKEGEGHIVKDKTFGITLKYFENTAEFSQRIKINDFNLSVLNIEVEYMVCDDKQCLPPTYKDITVTIKEVNTSSKAEVTEEPSKKSVKKITYKTLSKPKKSQKGLWTTFFIAFLSGLAALLTPCVFPMIPLTVSFFTKHSKSKADGIRKAILYGIFIIVIYVFLGAIITAIFGADALNALSTNVWFNLIFFLILVIFAISFLGAFEIRLPSSWANKVDSQSDKGGIAGIFFMALALAIVSFSCTGPIVGTLLVEFSSKGGIAPIIGMLGFSSAFALPFGLFAAFPGWMKTLPKSGGWLNTVKVTLGFLELALALKFLSNVDLVLQMHLLEREIFLVIWIAIFTILAFYLFGKIQLPHDEFLAAISVPRVCFGILVLAFVFYLIPGLAGAPLRKVSGFLPPDNYSEMSTLNRGGLLRGGGNTSISLPEDAHKGPLGLVAFHDYNKGVAYAKKVNKPIFLDFTGYACVNCRKIESSVWSDSKVFNILQNEVVLISLYVDDKRALPEGEELVSKISGKKLRYIGQKWSEFQILKYNINAQPFYVLLDHQGNLLNEPIAFEQNINAYYNWLKEGIKNFK